MRAVPVSGRSGGFDCSGAEHAVAADTAAPAITIFIVLGIPFILILLSSGLSGLLVRASLPGAYPYQGLIRGRTVSVSRFPQAVSASQCISVHARAGPNSPEEAPEPLLNLSRGASV